MVNGPSRAPLRLIAEAKRKPTKQGRERPDQVEQAADQRVGSPPEVARGESEGDCDEHGQRERAGSDQDRGPPSVQEPDHEVPAVLVRAEEVCPTPGRADRHTVERDHVDSLAVQRDLVGQVVHSRVVRATRLA